MFPPSYPRTLKQTLMKPSILTAGFLLAMLSGSCGKHQTTIPSSPIHITETKKRLSNLMTTHAHLLRLSNPLK